MVIIEHVEDLLRTKLKKERGNRCEICGHGNKIIGLFHILPKSLYPRLRFCEANILLACWFPCHDTWHHNYFKAPKIEERIKKLRGNDYMIKLKTTNATAPKLTMHHIGILAQYLRATPGS